MLIDAPQTSQALEEGTVAWHAAIGDYRIICTIVRRAGEPSVVSVVENGQHLDRQLLADDASAEEAEEAALLLQKQYEPRIAGIAKRTWRFGRNACLTTSWTPRTPTPDDPAAA